MHESRVVKEWSADIRYNYFEHLRNSYLIPYFKPNQLRERRIQEEEYMPGTETVKKLTESEKYF